MWNLRDRLVIVDVLGVLAAGEVWVDDHDGSAVHDEVHLAPEGEWRVKFSL